MRYLSLLLLLSIALLPSGCTDSELPANHGGVVSQLYKGKGDKQPLVVGLGGSEGGNAWASDYWRETREQFLSEGYAFLALGYFGLPGTPEQLDRISVNAVYEEIVKVASDPAIDKDRIAIVGGSKGAELALVLACHFPKIKCVVGLVPTMAVFPALTVMASTSSWSINDEEVPYVPMPWSAVPAAIGGNLRGAFEVMLEDTEAVREARIQIEKINGPILLVSATDDEMWPSKEMSVAMMSLLSQSNFTHPYKHIAIEGNHAAPLAHFDSVFTFLETNFKSKVGFNVKP